MKANNSIMIVGTVALSAVVGALFASLTWNNRVESSGGGMTRILEATTVTDPEVEL